MKATFFIQNLKCEGCQKTIVDTLNGLAGVDNVTVDVEVSSVTFEYAQGDDLSSIEKKLSSLGYPVYGDKNTFVKKATSYLSCAIGRMR